MCEQNVVRRIFVIYYDLSTPSVLVSLLSLPASTSCANKEGQNPHWCLMRTDFRMGWWENDIFIRGFVRLGFSVWEQERPQRHMPSIWAQLMRIICSQTVRRTRMRTFNTAVIGRVSRLQAQGVEHAHWPTNNPSTSVDRPQNRRKWVRAQSIFLCTQMWIKIKLSSDSYSNPQMRLFTCTILLVLCPVLVLNMGHDIYMSTSSYPVYMIPVLSQSLVQLGLTFVILCTKP